MVNKDVYNMTTNDWMLFAENAGKVELRQTGRYLPKRSKSCYDVLEYQGQKYNGVQQIFLGINEFHAEVYCDMETREGGWTVVALCLL